MRVLLTLLAALLTASESSAQQTLTDPSLTLTLVLPGGELDQTTSMAFVAPNDFLVLEKATGRVFRILNDELQGAPVLDVAVNSTNERGLLGIAVNTENPPAVFLYFTEAASDGGAPLGNRVYRYTWNASAGLLQSPQLILDLPVLPGPNHDGGVLMMGVPSDGGSAGDGAFLYTVIGDLNHNGRLQNNSAGANPDDTGVILRVEQDGTPAASNPFTPYCSGLTTLACDEAADCTGNGACQFRVASYFAYGVRNCFGMTRDPFTGEIWMTENGPSSYDEVNRVLPGWNSGWNQLLGPDVRDVQSPIHLWHMPGMGSAYSDPEFSWLTPIAVTGIAIPYGSTLGEDYDHKAIVGDANLGQLYAFPLNASHSGFDLAGFSGVADLVADNAAERNQFLLGSGFHSLTDLEIGPDKNLYLVSVGHGAIWRIQGPRYGFAPVPSLPVAGMLTLGLLLAGVAAVRLRRTPSPPRS